MAAARAAPGPANEAPGACRATARNPRLAMKTAGRPSEGSMPADDDRLSWQAMSRAPQGVELEARRAACHSGLEPDARGTPSPAGTPRWADGRYASRDSLPPSVTTWRSFRNSGQSYVRILDASGFAPAPGVHAERTFDSIRLKGGIIEYEVADTLSRGGTALCRVLAVASALILAYCHNGALLYG